MSKNHCSEDFVAQISYLSYHLPLKEGGEGYYPPNEASPRKGGERGGEYRAALHQDCYDRSQHNENVPGQPTQASKIDNINLPMKIKHRVSH